jgi:NAD(P)-dependent dehydrogenase (short-subunit alcohol dehydrogenase family)
VVKSVLVTGGARRVGKALCLGLAREGWRVVVHYHTSGEAARAVVARIRKAGGVAEALAANLACPEAAAGLIERAGEVLAGGVLDCVINNAAVFENDSPFALDLAAWETAMAVNARAPAIIGRSYHAAVEQRGGEGCIINILDNKLFALNPDFYSYTLSKAALHAATRMMAMAYAPHLRVCGIAPALTLISGAQTPAGFARAHRMNPLRRGVTPDDIVEAVKFIAASPALTGQVIVIDSGQSLMGLPRDVAFLDGGADDPA